MHKDYLGSILAISDEAGNKIEQRHFDAWGNLTHLQVNGGAILTDENQIRDIMSNGGLLLDRGYTSHEHFAEVGLIHMNGRLYDPLLRRFLNADAYIQDPYNSQNYNMYAYVLNNPLMFFDPSGMLTQQFIDEILASPDGTVWTNTGSGFTNNWGGSMDYNGNPLNYSGYSNMGSGGGGFGGSGGGLNGGQFTGAPYSPGEIHLPEVILTGHKSTWGSQILNSQKSYMDIWNSQHNNPIFNQSYYNSYNYPSSSLGWYDDTGKTNYIFGLVAMGVEKLSGKTRITTYGNSQLFHFENPNTGRVFYGNKYVRTQALSSIGKKMGIFGFGVGLFIDGIGVINYKSNPTSENSVHPAKAGLNTVMGIYGFTGVGTVTSLLYGAVDGFYPGGWPAAFDELDQLQQKNQKILGPNWKIVPYNKF